MATVKAVKAKRGVSKQDAFIGAFVACASITKAAAAVPIDRSLHYRWLVEDPEYFKRFEAARKQAGEALEDEAVRRAYEGYDEPVVYQGGLCYSADQFDKKTRKLKRGAKPLTVRKYDSGLLHKLLDGFLPERYKKRGAVEVTGANGGPIKLENEALRKLSDEELAALIALSHKLAPSE